jgi:hypothetical protein
MTELDAARHEAAHVVTAALKGIPVRSALVFGDGSGASNVSLRDLPVDEQGASRMTDYLIMLTAGEAADVMFGVEAVLAARHAASDREVALTLASRPELRWRSPEGQWQWAMLVSRQLVRDRRPAIERFAQVLLACGGRLGGTQVRDALDYAFGRRGDPPRPPTVAPRTSTTSITHATTQQRRSEPMRDEAHDDPPVHQDPEMELEFVVIRRRHFEAAAADTVHVMNLEGDLERLYGRKPTEDEVRARLWAEATERTRAGKPPPVRYRWRRVRDRFGDQRLERVDDA